MNSGCFHTVTDISLIVNSDVNGARIEISVVKAIPEVKILPAGANISGFTLLLVHKSTTNRTIRIVFNFAAYKCAVAVSNASRDSTSTAATTSSSTFSSISTSAAATSVALS